MKTRTPSPLLTACLVGCLSLSGCLEITSTSTVNTNGSIVRTITFSGDSAEVCRRNFPIVLDSSWTTKITRLSPTSTKDFTLTATRTFQDVAEMNRSLGGTFSWTLQYRFELEKSFQWFFTVYRYKETTVPYAQYTSIPMSDFLSHQEITLVAQDTLNDPFKRLGMSRGDSLAMESLVPRLKEWEWRNRFEPLFVAFLDGVKMLNTPLLPPEKVIALKDSLYRRSEYAIDKGKFDSLRVIFRTVLKTPLVDKALDANMKALEEIKRRFEFENAANSHNYVTNVVMPGLITGSNARKIEGNTATWEDYKEFTHHFEFTMWVESRQVNWWAVIVAFVVAASLMALMIVSALRRRNRL